MPRAAYAAFIEQLRGVDGALADKLVVNCYDGADTAVSEEPPPTLPPTRHRGAATTMAAAAPEATALP